MNKLLYHKKNSSRGAALMLLMVFFMMGSLVVTLGIGRTAYYDALRSQELTSSAQAFFTTESAIQDAVYRLRKGRNISTTEVLSLGGAAATTTIATVIDAKTVTAQSEIRGVYRSSRVTLHLGDGASFNFGLQSNTGGITMANSSSVVGNVYSNGPVTGSNNYVYGDVVSAGPSGLISGIRATSSAYANTIQSSTIDKDAYYQSISGTTVFGSACPNAHCYPGSTDQPTSTMPLDDEMIDDWKTQAAAGGVISSPCPYIINSDTTIGTKKITCDVEIDKSSTEVTLTGPLWITGNLTTKNGPTFMVDSSLAGQSVVIVTDDPQSYATGSTMTLDQGTGFVGATGNSYIIMISMNRDASIGGGTTAISAGNKTTAGSREVIYYAPYGKISASQSVKMRGATAHLIALSQTAAVDYETGMVSLLFTGGAGGSYAIDSWEEVE